jgi:hypothetical protein
MMIDEVDGMAANAVQASLINGRRPGSRVQEACAKAFCSDDVNTACAA